MLKTYGALLAAIGFEVVGTTFLQRSGQFSKPAPTLMMGLSYLASFYFLSLSLRVLPVGIAYAIWSGLGIVLISTIGLVMFNQKLDLPAILGLALIISGVITINLFSKVVSH